MLVKHTEVSEAIVSAFYAVYNQLGIGFSEKVYHGAMMVELQHRGLRLVSEQPIRVHYHGHVVGEFFADLVVNDCIIVGLKAVKEVLDEHRAQLLNYLKATKYEVGLLLNFGPDAKPERKVYDNSRKGNLSWICQDAIPASS